MPAWSSDELDRLNGEEYVSVAVALLDGSTPKSVNIWSVPVGDRLYIRSFNGTSGGWFGPALESRRGHISSGGVGKDVVFVPVDADDEETNTAVDASFRSKYATSQYAVTMSTDPVRLNTLEVVPA